MSKNYGETRAAQRTRDRWRLAHAISEKMGISPKTAWKWIRTLRKENIDLHGITTGDHKAIETARAVIGTKTRLPSMKVVTPLEWSARRARKGIENGGEAPIILQRVQIMLWAIGKCGSTKKAHEALKRACAAIKDVPPPPPVVTKLIPECTCGSRDIPYYPTTHTKGCLAWREM